MRIGFDVSQTGASKAGCGYVAYSLIEALLEQNTADDFILYPYFGSTYWDPNAKNNTYYVKRPDVARKIVGSACHESMAFWRRLPPDGEERLGRPDIVHSNNFSCPRGLKRARLVYTLHDLGFLESPEYTTELNRWVCFNGVFEASLYADAIVAVSNYSRQKFLEFFPHYPADRIQTAHLGSRFAYKNGPASDRPPVFGLYPEQFWLSVGTLEPRKNIRSLLEAYAIYTRESRPSYPLVLCGGEGWMEEGLDDYMDSLGIGSKVILTGYTTDEQLAWLYHNCFAFLYPSFYEGFGLPVLEAMSLGAAVVSSNVTSLPEVAGDAALYVNPNRIGDIVRAMTRLGEDPDVRKRLKSAALDQAHQFSWESFALEVREVYKKALDRKKYREPER